MPKLGIFLKICVLVSLTATNLSGQQSQVAFERLNVTDGLSQSTVQAILQDRRGFIWFGTLNGLNRYDGYEFVDYRHNPNNPRSISSDQIYALCEDRHGNLWVGTVNGLNKYDWKNDQFISYQHVHGDTSSLSNNLILSLYEDRDGVLWIGTHHGLNRYNEASDTFTRYLRSPNSAQGLSHPRITALFEDRAQNLWIGTGGGTLDQLDPSRKKVQYHLPIREPYDLQYRPDLISAVQQLAKTREPLAALSQVGDSKNLSTRFNIASETQVLIVATGEGYEKMFDFGWLDQAGREVWRMSAATARHAGGSPKNKIEIAVQKLHPGDYSLNFQSDSSHAFGRWNSLPPNRQDWWGVQVFAISAIEAKQLAVSNRAPYRTGMEFGGEITSITQDRAGVMWIGSSGGLLQKLRIDRNSQGLATRHKNFQFDESIFSSITLEPGQGIKQICDLDTTLWIATGKGLLRWHKKQQRFEHFRHNPHDLASLSTDELAAIYQDRSGSIWIGTILGGVNKINRFKNQFKHYTANPFASPTLRDKIVYSFAEAHDGALWIGTRSGISLFDRKTRAFQQPGWQDQQFKRMQSTPILALLQSKSGAIWAGSDGFGLARISPDFESFTFQPTDTNSLSNNRIWALYEDADGVLWIGTSGGGLNRFDPETRQFEHFMWRPNSTSSLSSNNVRAIYEDQAGQFWLGTHGGLNRFDKKTGRFTAYFNDPADTLSISHNIVTAIYEQDSTILWVATYGGGLNKLDRRCGKFERFTENAGLPNNVVYAILPDELGNLWLSTNRGISRFDPVSRSFKNYDVDNGLQSSEFNTGAYLKSRDGSLLFGGINGFNIIEPAHVRDNSRMPAIVITGLKKFDQPVVFDQAISEMKEIRLKHHENFITLNFAVLDYANPRKNRYAYKLEGLHDGWVHCGNQRFASFTNLSPGSYTFRVIGANNDGVWNETGASLKIVIVPPWWQAMWLKIIVVSVLVLAGVAFVFVRSKRAELQRHKLELLVAERTNALEQQKKLAEKAGQTVAKQAEKLRELDRLKSDFFANISHEFRTPLTLILGPLNDMLANGYSDSTKRTLRTMQRNAQRLMRLINQLLDLSRLENGKLALQMTAGDLIVFLRGTLFSFSSLAQSREITLQFHAEVQQLPCLFDRDKIEKIFYNLISNAIKFTPPAGSVSVDLYRAPSPKSHKTTSKKQWLHIAVRDTGIGIAPEHVQNIFDRFYQTDASSTRTHEGTGIGLALTKELVELHGGRIEVKSGLGSGTEFVVKLPVERADEHVIAPIQESPQVVFAPTEKSASPASKAEDERGRHSVLIVEDNAEVVDYIREHLQKEYTVVAARDGEQGILKAQKNMPDLIVADVMMPKMDGYAMCRVLKSEQQTSHIPIILLTARAADESRIEGLETGADDYLTKPFHSKELSVRIRNLIHQRRLLQQRFSKQIMLEPAKIEVSSIDEVFLQKLLSMIEHHLTSEQLGPEFLCRIIGMSLRPFQRKVKALTGQSPNQLIRTIRLKRARQLLDRQAGSVSEIAFQVGFNNLSYFAKCFREQFGILPSELEATAK